jgi:hypothetical protein
MTSDSDDAIGRQIDHSSEDEERKPQPVKEKKELKRAKTTNEIAQPIPSAPLPTPPLPRLTKARRDAIIAEFEQGKEDGEYAVTRLANGKYRVSKRKTFYTPDGTVSAGKGNLDITWVNQQQQRDNSLIHQLTKLNKKYKKLAKFYDDVVQEAEEPLPPPPPTPAQFPEAVVTEVHRAKLPFGKYKTKKFDIRNI